MILTLLTSEQQENSKKAEHYICQLRSKPKFTLTHVEESLHIFTDCFLILQRLLTLPHHCHILCTRQNNNETLKFAVASALENSAKKQPPYISLLLILFEFPPTRQICDTNLLVVPLGSQFRSLRGSGTIRWSKEGSCPLVLEWKLEILTFTKNLIIYFLEYCRAYSRDWSLIQLGCRHRHIFPEDQRVDRLKPRFISETAFLERGQLNALFLFSFVSLAKVAKKKTDCVV